MHSYQSYLQGLSSPVLKGALGGWCEGQASYVEDAVILMVDILRSRGDLDPETAALTKKCLEEARQENRPKRKWDNNIDLESFYNV